MEMYCENNYKELPVLQYIMGSISSYIDELYKIETGSCNMQNKFKRIKNIFEHTGHIEHYKMMMKE